jgi:hypothetical protein
MSQQCIYCKEGKVHPLFAYLLSDKRCVNNAKDHKVVPYIGLASNPFIRLCTHNRSSRKFGAFNQLTKGGAGYYQIELVFGPLTELASQFKEVCRKSSRKIHSRIVRFCQYANYMQNKMGVNVRAKLYARDKNLVRKIYPKAKVEVKEE